MVSGASKTPGFSRRRSDYLPIPKNPSISGSDLEAPKKVKVAVTPTAQVAPLAFRLSHLRCLSDEVCLLVLDPELSEKKETGC
ncbi:hypothetical protein MTO96_001332 [Rhipicephalus appendiculatus]